MHVTGMNVLGAPDAEPFETPTVLASPTGEKLAQLAAGPDYFIALINGKVSPSSATATTPAYGAANSSGPSAATTPSPTAGPTSPARTESSTAVGGGGGPVAMRPRGTTTATPTPTPTPSPTPTPTPAGRSVAATSATELAERVRVLEAENGRLKAELATSGEAVTSLAIQARSAHAETELLASEVHRLTDMLQKAGINFNPPDQGALGPTTPSAGQKDRPDLLATFGNDLHDFQFDNF